MYEGFFGLSKRPFSAVPNPDSFVGFEPAQEALDALLTCLTQARGIAVVTSAAGLGKTLLCKRLAEDAEARFQPVYLSNSAFSTRRALLQAVLYEFGVEYEGLTEQEARLKILEASRAIAADGKLLLILVDEAHLLNNRLFEELRGLTDYAPDGEALIRLVLSGHFELEEKLTDPALSAVNQRIGCQICLEPLSLEQSAELLIKKLVWSGAKDIETILTEPALEAICRASDGNPRCLCQLADHSFLLAFAEEEKPVSRDTVVAALDDLKELPLHWNDLPDGDEAVLSLPILATEEPLETSEFETEEFDVPKFLQAQEDVSEAGLPDSFEVVALDETQYFEPPEEDDVEYAVIEVGADLNSSKDASEQEPPEEVASDENCDKEEADLISLPIEQPLEMQEEIVVDKFADLDKATEIEPEPITELNPPSSELPEFSEEIVERPKKLSEEEILETVESLRKEIGTAVDEVKERIDSQQLQQDFEDRNERDVVQPEGDEGEHTSDKEQVLGSSNNETSHLEPAHRFAQLFTRLSQRRRQILQQRAGQ